MGLSLSCVDPSELFGALPIPTWLRSAKVLQGGGGHHAATLSSGGGGRSSRDSDSDDDAGGATRNNLEYGEIERAVGKTM
jgi:hypothetical protein